MKISRLFSRFFESEKASAIVLLLATISSLIIANTSFSQQYFSFWNCQLGGQSLSFWINEGLMAIFFLMVGLELEREINHGELSNIRNAALPIIAAVGGVMVPAVIYYAFNHGTDTSSGTGIPMATDIAFAIGLLSLLGNKVPASLKVFLTALAVIDDLIAIIIIAIFYSHGFSLIYFALAMSVFVLLLVFRKMNVKPMIAYILPGIVMWFFMLKSGVHATISGVILAFAIPYDNGSETAPSWKLQESLHFPVNFVILPLFALANTAISFSGNISAQLLSRVGLGIIGGLVLGKPIGIILSSLLAMKLKIASLPEDLSLKHIIGAGLIAGIGFTMSIFIAMLAFKDESHINAAKISIITASLFAGTLGLVFLKLALRKEREFQDQIL